MIKKWSKYVISFIFAFFISLTVTHAKELTLSELADKVLEIEPNATSVFVIGQHVFTSEHLLTTQDTMLAARTITASSNSAGREIYDEMTISYFEGTYDDDWNVVGFEFYQNLVGKTPAKDSYNICYVDYTYICDGSEVVTPTKYKVTFVNEYGTSPTAQSIEAGGKAVEPSIVDVEGYDFIGWYLGEDKYNFETAISGDITLTARYKKQAQLTTNVGDTTVGTVYEFEVTTIANDYAGVMVVGTSSFSNPEAIEKLEYYEPITNSWYELTSDFGPASGFPLGNVTSRFRVTWKTPGEYTFTMKIVEVADKSNVLAQVEKTVNITTSKHTVTWLDEDGTVLETDTNVEYGTKPTFDGKTPSKESTDEYTYEFAGWDKEVSNVTEDVTYKATYTATKNKYKVTFVNYDDTELYSVDVEYGSMPTYVGDTPVREKDDKNTYTFIGWSPELAKVTGVATYKAEYTTATNVYTVTWKNHDGSVLKTDTVEYGKTPEYTGETPTKESDNTYRYIFDKWNKEIVAVTKDAEYTATFKEEYIEYRVIFQDEDGTEISNKTYHYGDTVEKPVNPSKASTDEYTYEFAGWDKEVSNVTEDVTYKATYTATKNKYKVTFVNYDDTELYSVDVEYGSMPTYVGDTPVREKDDKNTYTFIGWSPELAKVTGVATYKAEYTTATNVYTVTWKNHDGSVLKTDTVEYGKTPEYTGETPTKESDNTYRYIFDKWNKEIVAVTKDAEYTATFKEEYIEYRVIFQDEDGTEISNKTYHYGDTVEKPVNPSKASTDEYTYEFAGWDKEVSNVTEDVTYKATYTTTKNKYTVTFVNYDGTVLYESEVEYGKVPEYTGTTPTKESDNTYSYTFDKWNKEIVAVTKDVEYTATFKESYIEYTIKFVDDDGTELSSKTYHYGDTVTIPNNPSKDATDKYIYEFAGWDKEVTTVAKNETYKATYNVTELINVDQLVNNAFDTINGYGAIDKFEASLNGNTVTVTVIDPTMNSIEALIGTGIAPAASEFLKTEGIKSVTLTSGEAELVVTKTNLKPTDVYNFLIAITKDSATAADLDGTIINISIAMEDGFETLNSDSFEVVIDVKTPAEITTTVGDAIVGEVHEFEVTTIANDYAGVMVLGTSSFSNPEAIEKLEYYEPSLDTWFELTTDFGPASGFPLGNVTSRFRVTWKTPGEYTFTMNIVDVNDKTKVYAELEKTVTVSESVALVANEGELLAALANPDYAKIELTDDITITSSVVISRSVVIDGKGHSIAKEGTPTYVSGGNNYIFKVYGITTADVKLENIKLTNAMAAIMVGDYAHVSLDNVDLDGNVWGGIEVKDTSTTSLYVNVENLAYSEEAYGKPIAWVDAPEIANASISFVLENTDWSATTALVKNQTHYYLDAANAVE